LGHSANSSQQVFNLLTNNLWLLAVIIGLGIFFGNSGIGARLLICFVSNIFSFGLATMSLAFLYKETEADVQKV
jgi:hypothetical protein